MNIYYIKKIWPIGLALLFMTGIFVGINDLFFTDHSLRGTYLVIASLMFIYLIYKITKEAVIITDEFIKIKTLKDEEMCNWEWIYEIKSERYGFPHNVSYTCIYWSKINDQQEYPSGGSNNSSEQKGKLVINSRFANYEHIVAYIVAKKKDVKIDKTTRKIIEKVK
jgi:hypothetical protein